MRPLRLLLDGFGSYRMPTEADFSDVDFFALTGPTGSGKSTLIDGLCFALYGTVPRWGNENAIAQALAPAANACRVCLVFETAGQRYAAVRELARDKKNVVKTRNARLELLDPAVPADAPLAELISASAEQLAEGPDQVKAGVQDILGLTYEHFTQSVLLPQGKFAEFLHAKPGDRQNLLVELLAFGVYDQVGQRARERAKLAAERTAHARRERDKLAGATAAAEHAAAERVAALGALAGQVEARLDGLGKLADEASQAEQAMRAVRDEATVLAAVRAPGYVAGLADQIAAADKHLTRCQELREAADDAERAALRALEATPDRSSLEKIQEIYKRHAELSVQRELDERALAKRKAAEQDSLLALGAAEREEAAGREALETAEHRHAAAAIAGSLRVGDDCPVCLRPVTALPEHAAPADLAAARAAAGAAARARQRAADAHAATTRAAAAAGAQAERTAAELDKIAAAVAAAPSPDQVAASLRQIGAAEDALRQARIQATTRRAEAAAAQRSRQELTAAEQKARAELQRARDPVVPLGAPAVSGDDLAAAWQALTAWAGRQLAERRTRLPALQESAEHLRQRAAAEAAELAALLASHEVPAGREPARFPAAVAEHRARAEHELTAIRRDLAAAAVLDEQIAAGRVQEQVAAKLGQLLRANSFEAWLCSEALDSLVLEASATLMELSGGRYELGRNDRNELVVIDYADAGSVRPVHTLSGGETFQASLALALALSRQVVGLSAGIRDLNSVFLDEGFGTLDEDTLETVATTLEQLAAGSDRMVGVVTHVAALADRVPVRFVVARAGTTSVLRKERL
jgi:DNA repair protein SbcC/Rad50